MFKVIRKGEATTRQITPQKIAINYITKEISPNFSLAVTKAENYSEKEETKYDRIYYVLAGELTLTFGSESSTLFTGDSCYIEKDTKYTMVGTFEAIVVNSPAYGS
jgi:mannose-6-phosphate isomerase-like protein (cupin superfamily)